MDVILQAINPKVYFGVNVKIKNNKKVLTPPNNWVNLSKPLYNNESNIGILCGEVNDFFVVHGFIFISYYIVNVRNYFRIS